MLKDRIEIKVLDINPKCSEIIYKRLQQMILPSPNVKKSQLLVFSHVFCIKSGSRRTASLTLFKVSTNNMLYYVGVLSAALVWQEQSGLFRRAEHFKQTVRRHAAVRSDIRTIMCYL